MADAREEIRLCDRCGKPDPGRAIGRQQEQLRPRNIREGRGTVLVRDGFKWFGERPDIRMGDIVYVKLVASSVEDVTAGFYCECVDGTDG